MRARWVLVLLALVLLAAPAASVPTLEEIRGGVDPRVPDGLYGEGISGPWVEFENATVENGDVHELSITVSFLGNVNRSSDLIEVKLEIYQYALYEKEEPLSEITDPPPMFIVDDPEGNGTRHSLVHWVNITVTDSTEVEVPNRVVVPDDARSGYYRVRISLEWHLRQTHLSNAKSWGHHTPASWAESIRSVAEGGTPTHGDYIVSEGGVTAVPQHFKEVSLPNKVPDFSNFSTPVIRPGQAGGYGFTVTNRYDRPMDDVTVTIEFYMWATIEDAKPIDEISGPPPNVKGEGRPSVTKELGDLAVGGSERLRIDITTSGDTDKGTYFVRHQIVFDFNGTRFTMSSRGFFTFEQWEGFDYSNLYYQLGVAGIVPDSSFSVKDPVPLWPLATLIALCVLFGVLAVVFYLAEEHGDQYPRLKRGLQVMTGRWEERKRILRQRVEDLRGEDREGELDEEDSEGEEDEGDRGS
jgi:hypothetical protein